MSKSYLNFDLVLKEIDNNYQVHVMESPAGQASQLFTLPFSMLELENFILRTRRSQNNVRSLSLESIDVTSVEKIGGALYASIFNGSVVERFRSSLAIARHENKGLRIRLRLSGAPTLINIPWELLFDTANKNYLGLSVHTPIIRKLDLATQPEIRQAQSVLQVLVMISSPTDYQSLNVASEWEHINTATLSLQQSGRIVLTRVEPTLTDLQQQLRKGKGKYHIFHYIGHGGFDRINNDGVLVLENQQKKGHQVNGQYLGTILCDETNLQLVLLNSCSGGRTSVTDPFAGVGQSLLQKGVPAVIAMQFEITDEAAITFSRAFYEALIEGYPIDSAVTEARKTIYAQANQLEWATPVLYTSVDTSSLLREPTARELKQLEEQKRQKEEAQRQTELLCQQEKEAKQKTKIPLEQDELISQKTALKQQQEKEAQADLAEYNPQNIEDQPTSKKQINQTKAQPLLFAKLSTRLKLKSSFWQIGILTTIIGGLLAWFVFEFFVRTQPIEPEMVSIPAGIFTMGCQLGRDDATKGGCNDDEKPYHAVSIKAFQMGKYEITFNEWDKCENDNFCPHADDMGWGRDKRPIISVSWDDINQKYLPWLNQKTGKNYRLPTEAEWEYAARAGKDTAFPWGTTLGINQANCDACGSAWDNKQTAPVGSFAANGYSLHDTSGNIWEWVMDCYTDSYVGAPTDGTARYGCKVGTLRSARGGSWYNRGKNIRSAARSGFPSNSRQDRIGFRLAIDY